MMTNVFQPKHVALYLLNVMFCWLFAIYSCN